jgi:DNA repair protein RecN (Recombination protein N)
MLRALTIQNVVLIKHLDLSFEGGLSVLSGETGAGKSILLDALGLAMGERGDSRLVRKGQPQATVTASFELPSSHPCMELLSEHGIESSDQLLLRRILTSEGRSRAFINDQPVSIGLLHLIGEQLIEIHGQFDRLLEPRFHREFLDAYARADDLLEPVTDHYNRWQAAKTEYETAIKTANDKHLNEAFLRHTLEELSAHSPKPGEEEELQTKRGQISNAAKIADMTDEISALLEGERGAKTQVNKALRLIEKALSIDHASFAQVAKALESCYSETQEACALLEGLREACADGPGQLDEIEKRLSKIRSLTRKHHCTADELPQILDKIEQDLQLIDNSEVKLKELEAASAQARDEYLAVCESLSALRIKAAKELDKAIIHEFIPLKLDQAQFKTDINRHPESQWGPSGYDQVKFMVSTNKGTEFGDLKTIASGGERSRFMLALKVILSRTSTIPTIIFDEIDSGIGGATARAIGERLARLGESLQALVITHSPQVASLASHHLRVEKASSDVDTTTNVIKLNPDQRREEIARMLAGEDITEEARAAADRLMLVG